MTPARTTLSRARARVTSLPGFGAVSGVSALTWIALGLIAAQAVLRGVLVARSWFLVDDHLFLGAIARGDDDLDWYLRLHQGHFMPLSFLLVKLASALGEPYAWGVAATQIVVLQVLASVACWWMLRTLFGPGRASLAGLAVYLTTAMTMPALMWWAVAINQLPHQVAFFGALTAHVLYARTRRRRWIAVAVGFLLIGYTTYAKTGLIVVTLGLLTLLWLVDGAPWPRFWRAVGRFWLAWVAYAAVSLGWLWIYLTRDEALPSAPATQFLPLAQSELFEALLPTLFGGPVDWVMFGGGPVQFVDPPLLLVVGAAVSVGLALLLAWARAERALLVLWPVAVYLFVSAVLVYTGRSYVISLLGGAGIGIHVQYLADAAPLLVLAAVALFRPVLGVADPIRPRPVPLLTLRLPTVAATLLVTLVCALGVASSWVYARAYADFPERIATQRAIDSLREADDPVLADVFVPSTILTPVFGVNAQAGVFFSPIADEFSVSTAGVDLQVLDADGDLADADVVPPPDLERTDAARIEGCEPVSATGTSFELEPPPALGLWLQVEYRSEEPDVLSAGGIGITRVGLEAPRGRHRLLVQAPRPGETVTLTAARAESLCVTSVEYGQVRSS